MQRPLPAPSMLWGPLPSRSLAAPLRWLGGRGTAAHRRPAHHAPRPRAVASSQQERPAAVSSPWQGPDANGASNSNSNTTRSVPWYDLQRGAQVAAWSGLCYLPSEQLPAAVAAHGLSLVAHGRVAFTSWIVADGAIDAAAFARANARPGGGGDDGDDDVVARLPPAARPPPARRERFVLLRGVQWSAPDMDTLRMSQRLASVWPVPFAAALTTPRGALVAHKGAAAMSSEVFELVTPYLDHASDVGLPVTLAGHSLGGALALLVMVLARLTNPRHLPNDLRCLMFGSPPVLAVDHSADGSSSSNSGGSSRSSASPSPVSSVDAAGAAANNDAAANINGSTPPAPPLLDALRDVLRVPAGSARAYVLEHDPVPRALLSVDPAWEAAKRLAPVRGLLQLRGWLLGARAPLSPGRFLFDAVGDVALVKWTPAGGSQAVPLDAHEVEGALSLGEPEDALAARFDPVRSARAWLDHHHGSYAQELEAAAVQRLRAALAEGAAAAADGGAAAAAPPAAPPAVPPAVPALPVASDPRSSR